MRDYIVGINYFNGWWRETPSKYDVGRGDWRLRWPERIPILGMYNDQRTMDEELRAAHEHGVDYFQMLWYDTKGDTPTEKNCLNTCFENYLNSQNKGKVKFTLEYCNHPPFGAVNGDEWAEYVREWIGYFMDPDYLRIDGKCLFKIHGLNYFFGQCDNDIDTVRSRLDYLRLEAEKVGIRLIITAGVMSGGLSDGERAVCDLVDGLGTYMDLPDYPNLDTDYSYGELSDFARRGRLNHAGGGYTYIPYLPAGWNPRPWGDPRASFSMPTDREWREALMDMREDLDRYESLRIAGKKLFTIYAWNEYGEGGIVAPTVGEGYMKLRAIREVFSE